MLPQALEPGPEPAWWRKDLPELALPRAPELGRELLREQVRVPEPPRGPVLARERVPVRQERARHRERVLRRRHRAC